MFYSGLFAAALISLILTLVSAFFLGKRGPWGSLWTFFLVLFLTLCTVSIYIVPIGPIYWGIAWIPITIAGIIVTILLIAAMPHQIKMDAQEKEDSMRLESINRHDFPTTPVGRFFWILIVAFIIAIILGMSNPQSAL
jgi:hypothetical protein